jgi:hypothetical protein
LEGPTAWISQRGKQEMDMVGHHNCTKKVNPYSTFPKTVAQDKIACCRGQNQTAAGAKSNEESCVGFLKVRKAATILILRR